MHDLSSIRPVPPWDEFVPIYLPAIPDQEFSFDATTPHYEVNYCELQGSATPCDTSSGRYYGTTEPLAPRLCPRHYRELLAAVADRIEPSDSQNAS